MLDLIEPFLQRDNLVFTRYDGSMRNDHREASLERLRNNSKCRILLCSLKCGSLGLNLTAASRVVILETVWEPIWYVQLRATAQILFAITERMTCLGSELLDLSPEGVSYMQ